MALSRSAQSNQLVRRAFDEDNNAHRVTLSGASSQSQGRTKVAIARHNYASVTVTTGAYVELISSIGDQANELQIFDSSGQTLVLAIGSAGNEVDQIYVFPGGNGNTNLKIPTGSRVSVKAVSNSATAGELTINFLK